jgi:hypothetical protein
MRWLVENQSRSTGLTVVPVRAAVTPHRSVLTSTSLAICVHTHLVFARARANNVPDVVLSAWERPEDLRFLTGQRTGVAFLEKTIELSRTSNAETISVQVVVRPRLQPLRVALFETLGLLYFLLVNNILHSETDMLRSAVWRKRSSKFNLDSSEARRANRKEPKPKSFACQSE